MRYLAEYPIENNVAHTTFPFVTSVRDFPNADTIYLYVKISAVSGAAPLSRWALQSGAVVGGSLVYTDICNSWVANGVSTFVMLYSGRIVTLRIYCNVDPSVSSLTSSITCVYWGS